MDRITDALASLFFGILNFFEGMRQSRGEDPLVTEYKSRKWAVVWSFAAVLTVFLAAWAAAGVLTALDSVSGAQNAVSAAREFAGSAFLVTFGLAMSFAAWAGWSLFTFKRANGLE